MEFIILEDEIVAIGDEKEIKELLDSTKGLKEDYETTLEEVE